MSRKRSMAGKDVRIPGKHGFSAGRRVAAGFLLLSLSAAFAHAGSDPFEEPDALKDCAAMSEAGVPVIYDAEAGLFAAENGERFIASDILLDDGAAITRDEDLSAVANARTDLKALRLGPANRWGLIPAWIVHQGSDQPFLLQAGLLREGKAVYAPRHVAGVCADRLRQLETAARQAEVGLWDEGAPPMVLPAAAPKRFDGRNGHYVIARGRIVSLGKTRTTRYLNFGKYWKTDFTVTLKASEEESFNAALEEAGWKVDALAGQTVEVRGTVQEKDGPHIALHHPEQLVVLEPAVFD